MSDESILKRKRLEKDLTLDDVEKILKIRKRHLIALEEGNYTDTPGVTYAIGYAKVYSMLLELDEDEKKKLINEIKKAFEKKEKKQFFSEKEVIPLDKEEEKPKKSKKAYNTKAIKKGIALISIVVIIAILGFFGFRLLTQEEGFSFKKEGIYTPYIKVTMREAKELSDVKKSVTPKAGASQTPTTTQTPSITPTATPLPKMMAKYNIKIIPKNNGWIKVYTKKSTLFEGVMLKGKEYVFRSAEPIMLIVENSDLFDIYIKNKKVTLPEGSFIEYALSEEAQEQNG